MRKTWTRRLKFLGASIAIALVTTGCGSVDDGGDASVAGEDVAATTASATAEPTQPPERTASPTSTAIPVP